MSRRPGATARDARILIVDDETRDIDAACAALRGGGFHAIESTSVPSEVPAICSRFAPDVVLLDLEMPGVDSFALVDAVLTKLPEPRPAAILMAAGVDGDLRTRIFERGAWDYVAKPLNTRELLARVSHAAETRCLRGAVRDHEAAADEDCSISAFTAETIHELRTPLNAICGYAEMMTLGVFGPIEQPKYAEYVHLIHGAGMHLRKIIDGLLDFARAGSGEQHLDLRPVEIGALVKETTALLRADAKAGGVDLSIVVDPKLTTVRTDPTKLRQIILNLGSNAVKYTPRGGRVTIEARPGDHGGVLVFVIRDTGVGIAPEDIAVAMRPFGRVQRDPRTAEVRGTGLGLPLTQRLVELLGGTLRIDSDLSHGTVVTVRLPAEPVRRAA